jgi:hypothetical protein
MPLGVKIGPFDYISFIKKEAPQILLRGSATVGVAWSFEITSLNAKQLL